MLNPIKTPTQMMYEQAGLPHFSAGGKTADVLGQFANRIQDAIRKYTKAAGRPPSAEEIKQLEDHIRALKQPSGNPAQTQARMLQETPFANQFVDQTGRPYPAVTTPEGRVITPERAKGVATRESVGPFQDLPSQFGMSPANIKARAYPKGQFQNAFPEDEFMSMANTGRTANRTWNKSFTPSTEELATRQQLGEEALTGLGDETAGAIRATEGDIPQMTSASAPFAERAAQLEGPGLEKLTDEMLLGKHGALVDKVVADFKARGIEPDKEDVVNAINAMINPMRHNYTGTNPIGMRPPQPGGGGRPTPEMMSWRDEARMSGLPETVVTKHPSDWKPQQQRDYLLDTEPAQRAPFAQDWQLEELMDRRRRQMQGKAAGGMMYSPRDMQAEMMVRGYDKGGQVRQPNMQELTQYIREGRSEYPDSATEVLMRNAEKTRADYDARAPKMSEYEPTPRERISSLGSDMLEKVGIRRPIARRAADTIVGGPSSNIPGGFGALDIAAFVNPAIAMMQAPMFAAEAGQNLRQGDYGGAAMSSLGALPLVGPIRKAYRGFNQ
jgi:hypothetical protein